MRTLLIALLIGASALPVFAPASSSAATTIVGPLRTSGNKILDGNGNPIIFRGVVIARMNSNPAIDVSPLSEASFDAMLRWRVNQVRVSLGQQYWLSNECQYTPSYATNVDTIVNRITSRGMAVMLSLGRVTRKTCGKADNARMADQASLEFWRQVAERYRSNPLVTFDLFNEPHDITWDVWKWGGTITDKTITYQAAGMQQMYDAVRSTGAQNLVYVSGNHWASKDPFDGYFLSGYNIVYGKHAYTCTVNPPPNCNKDNPFDPAPPGRRLSAWVDTIATHPVQITEFGWPSETDGTYNTNVITWAEDHGIGWGAFSWTIDDKFALVTDWGTYTPTKSGTPIAYGLLLNR